MEIKSKIMESLSEGNIDSALDFMLRNNSFNDILLILKYLLNEYENQKNLLSQFWQRSSDACPLEAIEHEEEVKRFEEFILLKK